MRIQNQRRGHVETFWIFFIILWMLVFAGPIHAQLILGYPLTSQQLSWYSLITFIVVVTSISGDAYLRVKGRDLTRFLFIIVMLILISLPSMILIVASGSSSIFLGVLVEYFPVHFFFVSWCFTTAVFDNISKPVAEVPTLSYLGGEWNVEGHRLGTLFLIHSVCCVLLKSSGGIILFLLAIPITWLFSLVLYNISIRLWDDFNQGEVSVQKG